MLILNVFIFMFGAIIGSFLNVLIHRLPLDENWVFKRSYCPQCKILIPLYRNIPLVSYILQLGKCHNCKTRISFRYPLVEFICGTFGLVIFPKIVSIDSLVIYFFFFSIFSAFLVHFIVDVKHQILPDEINIYLALLFSVYGLLKLSWLHVVLGGFIGFFIPYFVAYVFFKLRGIEGLGGGDIKLFGALGLYLGPQGVMLNIFLSCFLGSIIGILLILFKILDRNKPLAFGPFIIIAAFFQIFLPDLINQLIRVTGFIM